MDCNNCENFKPIKGEKINASYSIGDGFWIMYHDAPLNIQVAEIYICVTVSTFKEEYYLHSLDNKLRFHMGTKELNATCRTKEELMKKVFK